ncbi:MAG: amidase [Rhodospirillales bacterium]|nr:amidase [Rhodospirillales bacterium]MYE19876.1 amidase [Rhodospirillales bacterium]
MSDPWKITAAEAAVQMARGELTSLRLVESCLERIHAREREVCAWAHLDEDMALNAARVADATEPKSPFHGIPFGVKDIIDTADLPTECGTPIRAGHRPTEDAACVAKMKAAGAVMMGKTVTTEYALYHPGKTRNPINLAHTPGGSSSGSAAAVADSMVPVAFGSQTSGSLIRPAAFCGICAFKPTQGITDIAGMLQLEPAFDTLGYMGRDFDDLATFFAIVHGRTPRPLDDGIGRRPRIGLCRTPMWPHAEQASIDAVEDAAEQLRSIGADVQEVRLPSSFDGLLDTHAIILKAALTRSLGEDYRDHRDQMSPVLREMIEAGFEVPKNQEETLRAHAEECRASINHAFGDRDAFLCPSVVGEAPEGILATGNPVFQAMWTLLNVPIAGIPGAVGPTGLPVGIHLVGRRGDDETILRLGKWFHARRVADSLSANNPRHTSRGN